MERIDDPARFAELSAPWAELSDRCPTAHLFNHFDWLHAWWQAFATDADALRLYTLWEGSSLRGALPMYRPAGETRPRRAASLFNHYLGRTDVLAEQGRPDVVHRLLAALVEDRAQWDVAELSQMPEDSPGFSALRRPPARLGLSVHGVRTISSPYLELSGDYESWSQRRFSGRKRQQDRRRLRQAHKRGGQLELLTAQAPIVEAFERGLEVEALGWKGAQSSAMKSKPETAQFMRDVVRRFAACGGVRWVQLTIEDQLAGFLLGFVHKGCLYFHKTGFDPAFEAQSPGRLVLLQSIRSAFEEGLARYDFLGAADPYKLQCSPTVRPHTTLFLYHSGARSQAFRHVKRTFIPLVKRLGRPGEAFSVVVDR